MLIRFLFSFLIFITDETFFEDGVKTLQVKDFKSEGIQ